MTTIEIIKSLLNIQNGSKDAAIAALNAISAEKDSSNVALRTSQFLEGWIANWNEREVAPEMHFNAIAYFTEGMIAAAGLLPKDLK